MHKPTICRRSFLCVSGAFALSPWAARAEERKSTVAEIRSPALLNNGVPSFEHIRTAISLGVRELAGTGKAADAWRSLFSPTDTIGIKFNHVAGKELHGNAEIARALVSELVDGGISAKQILIIEGEHIRGTTRANPEADPARFDACGKRLWFRKYMTQQITALINVPLLKHHAIAGVSLGLKNLSHGTIWNPSHFHRDHCDPAIGSIVSLPPLRDKLRLTLCNALFGLADEGPYAVNEKLMWKPSAILMSRDVVALDTVGLGILRARRRPMGLPTLEEADQPPKHIATAARIGLGIADPAGIQIKRLGIPT